MADETVEIVSKPIEGLVAAIVSERQLAINIGSDHGVTRGMRFRVMTGTPTDITDPASGEKLGALTREKVRVEAETIWARFSVCKTYRTFRTGGLISERFLRSLEPSRREVETLVADDSDFIPELSEEESFVERGDRVEQILSSTAVTIQDVETTLKGAVLRGVLDRVTVEETVERWKQADAALRDAQNATQDRDEKLSAALELFNSSTSEITRLYNRVEQDHEDD